MKRLLLCVAAVIAGATFASAQDVKIEKKTEDRPGRRSHGQSPGPLQSRLRRCPAISRRVYGSGPTLVNPCRLGLGDTFKLTLTA
jgi:hypothetical protein